MQSGVLCVLLLAAAPVTALAQTTSAVPLDPQLEAILQSSNDHASQTDLDAANAYIASHPKDGNGFAVRCEVTLELADQSGGNLDAAMPDCDRAVSLSPNSAFVHYAKADAFYDVGKIAESVPEYTSAIALGEHSRGVFWKRCDAYRRTGKLDAALNDCNRQVTDTPDDFWAWAALGHLRVARNEFVLALPALSRALTMHSQDMNALYYRGVAYLGVNRAADAELDFTACLNLGDKSPDTLYERALARQAQRNLAGARIDAQAALEGYRDAQDSAGMNKAQTLLDELAAK